MEQLQDLIDFFIDEGVKEPQLKQAVSYIHQYTKKFFELYDIEATEKQIEDASILIFKAYLYKCKDLAEDIDPKSPDMIFNNILNELKGGDVDKAYQNYITAVGFAVRNEETRNISVEKLSVAILEDKIDKVEQKNSEENDNRKSEEQ